jgi:DNA-directed RNA polymerase subunit M/transcription elongation factor TFIIS
MSVSAKNKLDKLVCPKCNSIIHKVADGGGSVCYICSKCKTSYCHGLKWEMYDEKECVYKDVKELE